MNNYLNDVIAFFEKKAVMKVEANDRIYHDLGIFGIDFVEIFTDFEKEFEVDLDEVNLSDFDLEIGVRYLYYKWFKPKKIKVKPLTIAHLAKVVERGDWFYPNEVE